MPKYDVAKEALISLGFSEKLINNFQNKEVLEAVYDSTELRSNTTYTKIKEDGTSTEISKKRCLEEIENKSNTQATLKSNNEYSEEKDQYFKKTIMAIWSQEQNCYIYWAAFEWLTEPLFRSDDVWGIHVTNGQTIKNSGFATVLYETEFFADTEDRFTEEYYTEYKENNPDDAIHFNRFPRTITFKFNLPNSIYPSIIHKNFGMAIIFKGRPEDTDAKQYYNIHATYYHRFFKIAAETTISPLSEDIGFSVKPVGEYSSYTIDGDINYEP